VRDALSHFRLYEPGMWQFWRGNVRLLGVVQGLLSILSLAFPWFDTLRHWKYRKYRLEIIDPATRQSREMRGTDLLGENEIS